LPKRIPLAEALKAHLAIRSDGTGLAVAPDGRTILFAQVDQSVRDIMLVDHFH
jgi:hypothetical protein